MKVKVNIYGFVKVAIDAAIDVYYSPTQKIRDEQIEFMKVDEEDCAIYPFVYEEEVEV